jgi:hypothetical protein
MPGGRASCSNNNEQAISKEDRATATISGSDDARRVYEGVIDEAENSGEFEGRNVRKIWKDVRDRRESISDAEGA